MLPAQPPHPGALEVVGRLEGKTQKGLGQRLDVHQMVRLVGYRLGVANIKWRDVVSFHVTGPQSEDQVLQPDGRYRIVTTDPEVRSLVAHALSAPTPALYIDQLSVTRHA